MTLCVWVRVDTYLTQCSKLSMGELASGITIEIAMNVHELFLFDWFLANTKYTTDFLQ